MNTVFYSHIVRITRIHDRLSTLSLSPKEKEELIALSSENLHYHIMDLILSQLQSEDKKNFFTHMAHSSHEDIWKFLSERIADIESQIIKAADSFFDEIEKDIALVQKHI